MTSKTKTRKPLFPLLGGILLLIAGMTLAIYLNTGIKPSSPVVGIKLLEYIHGHEKAPEVRFQVTNEDNVVIERINEYRFQIPARIRSSDPSRDGRNFAKMPFPTNTPKLLKPGESMVLPVPVLTNAPSWRLQLHYATGAPPKRRAISRFLRIFPRYRRSYHPVQSDWITESQTILNH